MPHKPPRPRNRRKPHPWEPWISPAARIGVEVIAALIRTLIQ